MTRRAQKQWDSGRVEIHDPDGLASLLRAEIKKRELLDPMDRQEMLGYPKGAQTEIVQDVADQIGISRSLLHRLLAGKRPNTTWRTLRKLEVWLRPANADALRRFALTPDAQQRRKEYEDYLEREIERFEMDRTDQHDYLPTGEIDTLMKSLRTYVLNLGLPAPRARLAELRTVDPLIGWPTLRRALDKRTELEIIRDGLRRERRLVKIEARLLTPRTRSHALQGKPRAGAGTPKGL